jgi:hypothetical protein
VAVAAYEACVVDSYRALRGSWLLGTVLSLYYLMAFIAGLWLGSFVYDLIEPGVDAISLFIRPPGDIAFECLVLLTLLYVFTSVLCIVARVLVQACTYLCFEMRGDVLFYGCVLALIACALTFAASALVPPVLSENTMITLAGLALVGFVMFAVVVAWLFVRYRWAANPRGRKFDRDVGLAWSHMSDPRRARFSFDGGG